MAWEDSVETPHMLGTRRIGPDLSRAANTRTDQWHFAHLFAPRSVVPRSIMPSYPEFFDGTPTQPRQEALDLVAYLNTLGRSRELAWPEGEIAMREAAGDDQWTLMSLDADQLNAHPARTRPRGNAPACGIRHLPGKAAGCGHKIAKVAMAKTVPVMALPQPGYSLPQST